MSRLSKMTVQTALSVSLQAEPSYIVFTSQHGEMVRTRELLDNFVTGDGLSPTEFSQSVHNTGLGLYSIIRSSQAAATAIACGAASFASGWLEAEGYLAEHPDETVLLVDGDDVLPIEYQRFTVQEPCAYALALLLSVAGDGGTVLTVGPGTGDSPLPMGPLFLNWFLSSGQTFRVDAEGQAFTWERGGGA